MSGLFLFIFDIYELFIKFGLYLLVLVGIFFLFRKPTYAYYLTVFTIPFKSLYIWAGTNIEVWKLMSAMALVIYGPKVLIQTTHEIRKNHNLTWLLFFILYTLFITIVFYLAIPEADKHVVTGGFLKNEGRIIFQIIFFLVTINLILWPSYIFKNTAQAFYTLRVIVISVITLSALGLIQLVSLYTTGFDPFPIHRIHGLDNTGGMMLVQGFEGVQRINSLAGEPKHFAVALVIGFSIILLHKLNNIQCIRYEKPILGIFMLCLLATYSTTGYILFGVTIIAIMALYRQKFSGMALVIIALASLSLYIINTGTGGQEANFSYIDKTINNPNKSVLEIQDEAVLDHFINNPLEAITGLGLGNIHYYAVDYLPSNFPLFRDTPFKGNSGLFLLLGDVGLIGIFLLTLLTAKITFRRINKKKSKTIETSRYYVLVHLTLISYALFYMRYFELFYVVLGISFYYSTIIKKQRL